MTASPALRPSRVRRLTPEATSARAPAGTLPIPSPPTRAMPGAHRLPDSCSFRGHHPSGGHHGANGATTMKSGKTAGRARPDSYRDDGVRSPRPVRHRGSGRRRRLLVDAAAAGAGRRRPRRDRRRALVEGSGDRPGGRSRIRPDVDERGRVLLCPAKRVLLRRRRMCGGTCLRTPSRFTSPPTSGPYVGRDGFVQVAIPATHPSFFGRIFGHASESVTRTRSPRTPPATRTPVRWSRSGSTCSRGCSSGNVNGGGTVNIFPTNGRHPPAATFT